MKKFILILTLILSGCASTKPVAVLTGVENAVKTSPAAAKEQLEKPKATVDIDKELLKECDDFSRLATNNPTPNQILDQHKNDVLTHTTCKMRHSRLIKIVKDAFNIRE